MKVKTTERNPRERDPSVQGDMDTSKATAFDPAWSGLRIVMPSEGKAIRTVITGTKTIASASYHSRRNGRTLPTESWTELLGVKHDEVVVSTHRIRVQPFRIELQTSAGVIRHIPDKARQTPDGSWQIIDIKSDWKQFSKPEGLQQVMLGEMAADALGADYVREVRSNYGSEMFQENVELVQIYRFVNTTLRQDLLAADLLNHEVTVPLGRLSDLLDPTPANGFAFVCSMMARRLVEIDLASPITRHSAVTTVAPCASVMPDLFYALRATELQAA